eukprot:1286209-Pyramimonas_sp.AAC.2
MACLAPSGADARRVQMSANEESGDSGAFVRFRVSRTCMLSRRRSRFAGGSCASHAWLRLELMCERGAVDRTVRIGRQGALQKIAFWMWRQEVAWKGIRRNVPDPLRMDGQWGFNPRSRQLGPEAPPPLYSRDASVNKSVKSCYTHPIRHAVLLI